MEEYEREKAAIVAELQQARAQVNNSSGSLPRYGSGRSGSQRRSPNGDGGSSPVIGAARASSAQSFQGGRGGGRGGDVPDVMDEQRLKVETEWNQIGNVQAKLYGS